jgi:hypothetical protein
MLTALWILLSVVLLGLLVWGIGIAGSAVSDAFDPDLPHIGRRDLPAHVLRRVRILLPVLLALVPSGAALGFVCAAVVLLAGGGVSWNGSSADSSDWSFGFVLELAAMSGAPLGVVLAPAIYLRWLVGSHPVVVARVAGVTTLGTVTGGIAATMLDPGLAFVGALSGFGLAAIWAIRRARNTAGLTSA